MVVDSNIYQCLSICVKSYVIASVCAWIVKGDFVIVPLSPFQ